MDGSSKTHGLYEKAQCSQSTNGEKHAVVVALIGSTVVSRFIMMMFTLTDLGQSINSSVQVEKIGCLTDDNYSISTWVSFYPRAT